MYVSKMTIENFRCFGENDDRLEVEMAPGITALVGENDAGKTAIIDALRLLFGTRDQEYVNVRETDFHQGSILKTCGVHHHKSL